MLDQIHTFQRLIGNIEDPNQEAVSKLALLYLRTSSLEEVERVALENLATGTISLRHVMLASNIKYKPAYNVLKLFKPDWLPFEKKRKHALPRAISALSRRQCIGYLYDIATITNKLRNSNDHRIAEIVLDSLHALALNPHSEKKRLKYLLLELWEEIERLSAQRYHFFEIGRHEEQLLRGVYFYAKISVKMVNHKHYHVHLNDNDFERISLDILGGTFYYRERNVIIAEYLLGYRPREV